MLLTQLAKSVFLANQKRGWWTDIETGESIVKTRNRLELMMLIITEVREAKDAGLFLLKDDKLPQYYGCQAELADVFIRILDLLGADNVDIDKIILDDEGVNQYNDTRELLDNSSWEVQLLEVVCEIGAAAEESRKLRDYDKHLINALLMMFHLDEIHGFDLSEVIQAKLDFNASRSDHSMESRKADGGKKS